MCTFGLAVSETLLVCQLDHLRLILVVTCLKPDADWLVFATQKSGTAQSGQFE